MNTRSQKRARGGPAAAPQRFVIYMHTNKVTGKKYIGQTSKGADTRWRGHVKSALRCGRGCSVFYAAIRKYGPDAFEHEVLDIVFTQEGANIAERAWIKQRRTLVPSGYNLEEGGGCGPPHALTRATLREKALQREARVSPAERAAINQKIIASRTPAQRQAAAQKRLAATTPEQRSEAARLGRARMTQDQRSAIAVKINAAIPPGVLSELARKCHAARTTEERSAIALRGLTTKRARAEKKT